MEAASYSNAEMLKYTNIARDHGIDAKTVKEYFQILKDTLISYELGTYTKSRTRQIITSVPKVYFFDTGVINRLSKKRITQLKGFDAGKSFETYIMHELYAYRSIFEKRLFHFLLVYKNRFRS